jgi:hypothetical protein
VRSEVKTKQGVGTKKSVTRGRRELGKCEEWRVRSEVKTKQRVGTKKECDKGEKRARKV